MHNDRLASAGKRLGIFELMIVDVLTERRTPRHDHRDLAGSYGMQDPASSSMLYDEIGRLNESFEFIHRNERPRIAPRSVKMTVAVLDGHRLGQLCCNRRHRVEQPLEWLMGIADCHERAQNSVPPQMPRGK